MHQKTIVITTIFKGYGTNYFENNEFYEGEWFAGKRSGWGRMYFENGDIYEGEWLNDMRHGKGMLRFCNNNRYEGEWKQDKKNGFGKYFFLDKGQLLEGFWVENVNKTGKMIDFDRDTATARSHGRIVDGDAAVVVSCRSSALARNRHGRSAATGLHGA